MAVHPRIRGERCVVPRISSMAPWFIPAYAGNAFKHPVANMADAVHPRIRGERATARALATSLPGSSPHTRGTRLDQSLRRSLRRFIPAYAGNARRARSGQDRCAVHPRIRGERHPDKVNGLVLDGSSPHTRGTLTHNTPGLRPRRFIPAYAGNARHPATGPRERSVHPRIRGERADTLTIQRKAFGSSPHTRGTLSTGYPQALKPRFIPAYAGNACAIRRAWPWHAVHPRIRGERMAKATGGNDPAGSSPHTRGTRLHHLAAVNHGRFIPAYAGNARG